MSSNESNPSELHETASATPKEAQSKAIREKLSRQKKIQPEQIGLKVLVQPLEIDDTEVDVVAIHGIGATPEYTWVYKDTKVNWLSDSTMLPEALPNARIMSFNYESYWFGDNAIKQSISGVAKKLLLAINEKRVDCKHRPIIIIGHCFGGLIAQQCYITATNHQEDHPGVSDSLVGIVFLGTPHHGVHHDSGLQTMGQVYTAIAEANVQIQDNVLNTIAHDNDVLKDIVQDFTKIVKKLSDKLSLYCFYEQKTCHIGRVAGISDFKPRFLVTESSGTLDGYGNESLSLDHFAINKFSSKDDDNYLSVRRQILKMNEKARELIEGQSPEKTLITPYSPTPKHYMPSLAAPILKEENFADRDGIIDTIKEKFVHTSFVALHGGPGNGKTHVAVEYAHRFFQAQPGAHVHWVNAGSAAEFELSFKRIAETLHINRDRVRDGDVLEAVYETLNQDGSGRWLMVLDGLNDAKKLKVTGPSHIKASLLDFIPNTPHASVLITTRSDILAMRMVNRKAKYIIEVPILKDADASILLLGRKTRDHNKKQKAVGTAKELGSSAGTIILAYFYQKMASVSLKEYVELVRALGPPTKDTLVMTMRVWRVLYELIKDKNPEASYLLLLIGSLDVQCIPNLFFERGELSKQISDLVNYGVVEPSTDRRVIIMTAVFRQCVQKSLDEDGNREMIEEQALSVMCDKFQDGGHHTAEALLPCALAIFKFQPASIDSKRKLATLQSRVAKFYAHTKQYQLAVEHWERTVSLYEEDPDNNHALIEDAKRALKDSCADLQLNTKESHAKATKVGVELIANRVAKKKNELLELEKSAGEHHPDTIRKASDFATLQLMHGEKGKAQEAIELYQRALSWSRDKYGDDNIDTARRQYNLALAFEHQGKYDKAESYYNSALRIARQHFGPNSPEPLRILASMACMYSKQGRLEEAERAFKAALLGQREALGSDHPDTLVTRLNIAILLEDRGQVDAAAKELEQVLGVQVRLFGPSNPATLRTACSLARNYGLQGSSQEAMSLLKETLKIQEQKLGKMHPDTAMTRLILDELLQQMEMPTTQISM